MTGDGNAPEQVERTNEDSQLEDLMVKFSSRSRFRWRHVVASSESGAGPRSFEESTKECAPRRNEWSLEKVLSSSPTPRRKNRAMVIKKKWAGPPPSAVQDKDVCVDASSVSSSRSEILRGSCSV